MSYCLWLYLTTGGTQTWNNPATLTVKCASNLIKLAHGNPAKNPRQDAVACSDKLCHFMLITMKGLLWEEKKSNSALKPNICCCTDPKIADGHVKYWVSLWKASISLSFWHKPSGIYQNVLPHRKWFTQNMQAERTIHCLENEKEKGKKNAQTTAVSLIWTFDLQSN